MVSHKNHRKNLMAALPDGLIFLVSSDEKRRNSDVFYRFRQDSDFLYLTGITHTDHALLLDPKAKAAHLFVPDMDPMFQIWHGRQKTASQAKSFFGVDFVHYAKDLPAVFAKLSKKYRKLHVLDSGKDALKRRKIRTALKADVKTLRVTLSESRARKSEAELEALRTANRVSHRGHVAAMRAMRPGMMEYEVQAVMEREFLGAGAIHCAYPSIVASGANAAILHYHENDMACRSGDLILIDAGCEWQGYGSDVTRTFPVSGNYDRRQAEIYQIVLNAQKECIGMIRPGVSVLDLHRHACRSMTRALMELGIFRSKDAEAIVKDGAHAIFFPHGIGHLLGLDVHDVGAKDPNAKQPRDKPKNLRASRVLEPGFVLTVEPGLYFIDAHFESKDTHKKTAKHIDWKKAEDYRAVGGIRIEDDIYVTRGGHENLTTVPKEIREIEALMRNGRA